MRRWRNRQRDRRIDAEYSDYSWIIYRTPFVVPAPRLKGEDEIGNPLYPPECAIPDTWDEGERSEISRRETFGSVPGASLF